jgi:putative Holliday junction resolvase
MKYLGIDYGTKRVGTAMSDDSGMMAFPDEVLTNDSKLIQKLQEKIKKNNVKKVVIGESKNYKMEDNAIMTEILDLKSVIETTLEIDAVLQPEFMSSMQAEKIQGKNDMIDASAASIILKAYLYSNKKSLQMQAQFKILFERLISYIP